MAENTNPLTPQQLDTIVKALKERGGDISLMVAGETGAGKSTLINSFLGLKDPSNGVDLDDAVRGAREGDDVESVTESVSSYKAEKNGIEIRCFDTPGFEDTSKISPGTIIAQMSVETNKKLDLLLYCIKYEIGMRVKDRHRRMIHEITRAFKNEIWQKAVLVLTMVNTTLPSVSERQHTTKLENISNQLRDILRENGVPDDIVSNVPLVTAGLEKGKLPYETIEWTAKLFGHCIIRVNQDAMRSLLQIRYNEKKMKKVLKYIVGSGGGIIVGAGLGAGIGTAIGMCGGPPGGAVGLILGAIIGAGIIVGATAGGTTGTLITYKIIDLIAKCDEETQREIEVEREVKKLVKKKSKRSKTDKKNV